ncbi:thiol-disulfide isomerase/thioredoxin [Paenibacillus polymyxa]|uniref:TlpA family protein disulfide reductase n=1 Tax=Paenibacillus polymyxa TaxID=1406 RepID=UPI002792E136|nr:TlpA disulfide reductase family protein [Paenibacillus polymyxa]MDQ0047873.1 thiol-disulfide isomerase/thioredoxin [Paenibacillus polymyxa]
MKKFLFIRVMIMLVVVGASWGVIANTTYAATLSMKNAPLKEGDGREKLGQRLPSMILKGLNGKTYDVGATRNKALVISFWASWCDPCRLEAPMLNELYSKYKDVVDVYGINVTRYDRLEDVQKFSRSLDLRFPILLDEQGALFERFGGVAFPTHVMVDPHGQVREIIIGMLSEKELERKIEILQKKKVSLGAE